MKIGIDGRALQGSRTGVGRYVFELCKELDRQLPEALFYVYSNIPLEMPVSSGRWILRIDPFPWVARMKSLIWLKMRCGVLCREDDLDVFWGAATFLPNLPRSVRTIITSYDLNFLFAPDTMSLTHRWAFKLFFKRDLERADSVLAISQGTSDRLGKFYGRAADGIVYPSVGVSFKPQSEVTILETLSQLGLSRPYILAVATWEPRKNLELLMGAFINIKKKGFLEEYKLVLAGGRGWKDERLATFLAGNNDVIPIGFVPDQHLAPLYSGAAIFIFPSIYEGFGMPVLEARACGTKVITTDSPELREAGGRDAIYIFPIEHEIEKALLHHLSIGEKPQMFDRENTPTWTQGASTLINAFGNCAE